MSNLPDDLKYSPTHEWARAGADGAVEVGISDFAQAQLGDVVFIDFPETGRQVKAGEACLTIESVKAASDVYSPVSGEIVAVNEALRDAPEAVNEDCYANWLFRVQADDLAELDALLDAESYRASSGAD
jgi:glycine cleavage system H protein